jgi:UDP-GlcNAc:undecaprenyl-phosphate GlcNAc-1-phosphate transferase
MRLTITDYVGIFVFTASITAFVTPKIRKFAYDHDITDKPDGKKKIQEQPVAYLGGIAILVGFVTSIVGSAIIGRATLSEWVLLIGIIGPGILMALMGLVDDLKNLSINSRLVLQSVAAVLTCLATYLFTNTKLSIFAGATGFIVIVFWVIGITNAMNFLDNMNGLATSSSLLSGLTLGILAILSQQYLVAGFCIAISAACTGFLFFNYPKASIYLGDTGAVFLGFLLAAMAVRLNLNVQEYWQSLIIKFMVFILPIIDTSSVLFLRIKNGISPLQGGRDHLSHKLSQMQIPNEYAVLILLGIQSLFSIASLIFYSEIRF